MKRMSVLVWDFKIIRVLLFFQKSLYLCNIISWISWVHNWVPFSECFSNNLTIKFQLKRLTCSFLVKKYQTIIRIMVRLKFLKKAPLFHRVSMRQWPKSHPYHSIKFEWNIISLTFWTLLQQFEPSPMETREIYQLFFF